MSSPRPEDPELVDNSASFFTKYFRMLRDVHGKKVENWKKDADSVLIFTGLFAASAAVLVSVTVADLKPNPQEKSAFYLEKIYQLLANDSVHVSLSSIRVTPESPQLFSPPPTPNYVICANSLLFLSLLISLTYAMLAVMLQQWARRYLRIAQAPRPAHDAARISAFFARGFEDLGFSLVAETIPTLIHISLFLFFAGILIYISNINTTVFYAAIWWIATVGLGYLFITVIPIWRVDSPYHSPFFSSLMFCVYAVLLYLLSTKRFRNLPPKYFAGFHKGTEKMAEDEINTSPWKIDSFIVKWSFDAHFLASDGELRQFFNDIYGLYNSTTSSDPRVIFAKLDSKKFSPVLESFVKRTLSHVSLSDLANMEQFKICLKLADATDSTSLFLQTKHLSDVDAIDVAHSLNQNREMGLVAQTIVANIIVNVEERNERWVELAMNQFCKSKDAIQNLFENGNDNLLLYTWTHMARQISKSSSAINLIMTYDAAEFILDLEQRRDFDIEKTCDELRDEFCHVWDDIIPKARESYGSIFHAIVFLLRKLYFEIHPGTAVSFNKYRLESYPRCNRSHHRPVPSQQAASSSNTPHHGDTAIVPSTVMPTRLSQAALMPTAESSMNASDGPPHGLASSPSPPVAAFQSVEPSVPSSSDPSAAITTAILRVDEDTQERNTSSQVEPRQSRMLSQGRDSTERSTSPPHG